jgi:hypothetical protein
MGSMGCLVVGSHMSYMMLSYLHCKWVFKKVHAYVKELTYLAGVRDSLDEQYCSF